jgi:RimJ/RimL family protein N-acetyltransferase
VLQVDDTLLRLARQEPELRGRVFRVSHRDALTLDGLVVGFVTPHLTAWGWRHGPIFVLPSARRHGLVVGYYAAHPERQCVAFVADTNHASRRMHERAGFVLWRRGSRGWFVRREPLRCR